MYKFVYCFSVSRVELEPWEVRVGKVGFGKFGILG